MSDPPPSSEPLPRRFGRFVLFDKIGEGGMARIYLGRQSTELGGERLVVVKQILPILASSQEFSQLLIEEAKLAAGLSHGNVVQVIDLGREDDVLYIAMEYVEGFDLSDLLKRCSRTKTPLPVEFSILIVIETLRALDYAHRKKDAEGRPLGVVHRDVSPSNVLVSFDGEVKLCDFGIARAMGVGAELPTEAIQGKAGYMSPEAAAGGQVDARSDVFAAGVILWELLAGRRLYRGEGGRPPSLEQARRAEIPDLPARDLPSEGELFAIVKRALARNPDERWPSAREFSRELEDWAGRSGMLASPLRVGEWLMQNFGAEIIERRRSRERAAKRHEEASGGTELDSLAGLAAPAPPHEVVVRTAAGESSEPPRVESPPSLVGVVHSTRPRDDVEQEKRGPSFVLWMMIGVVLAVIVIAVVMR
ncbi:MAG: serine/threonine protein kinase [Polyangiaceae bacterium]|nr:serine/threonine protein kinase [Polyangiaceae bacterium]